MKESVCESVLRGISVLQYKSRGIHCVESSRMPQLETLPRWAEYSPGRSGWAASDVHLVKPTVLSSVKQGDTDQRKINVKALQDFRVKKQLFALQNHYL